MTVLSFSARTARSRARAAARVSIAALHLDTRPFLDALDECREIARRPKLAVGVLPERAHGTPDPHRHLELLRLLEVELHVLVHEAGGEAVVEGARQDRARELDLRRRV